jgi:prepilin-type N-terminal cleavage/methylation domain-containing protein
MRKQTGFTLIEIAIVLVIIGLLLGGVLKGQELIQSARVRNLASTDDGVKAAFFGFQDRFKALPGDYLTATTNINGATQNGNGDGLIGGTAATATEAIAVWDHLSHAGFLNGNYTYAATVTPGTTNPTNAYGAPLQLIYDAVYADAGTPASRHNLKLGNLIPAGIIAELDRKIDDGNAQTGSFRYSSYNAASAANLCHTAGVWIVTGTIDSNCGGATLF